MGATLHERIAQARQRLIDAGISPSDAAIDADVLARHVLGWDLAALLVHGREPASPEFTHEFDGMIARRAAHEPVAFITGHREFWGRDFEVTRDVLIPRPETELIVEAVLEHVDRSHTIRALDIGTGSGCLAVTLAAELPLAFVVATDISPAALGIARRNAETHGVAGRMSFVLADLLESISGPFDVVVSNPPYVPSSAVLPPDVVRYEPAHALFGGGDGLDALRQLIAGTRAVLAPDGAFVVEFGFGQSQAVRELAEAAGWTQVELREDLQGIPRVAVLNLRGH
jgi:release factor glutamine methyltransferase